MKNLQENLKLFYLGLKDGEPYLYKNKDLTTHATIIGMTGSGKTGLGITLLEEACIDNIPTFIIDPKGDLTNLCLTFPDMKKEDFLPYMDENEAQNASLSIDELATKTAKEWKEGIENSFQSLDRVKLFKESAEFKIYTPKSSDGISISLLNDFNPPNLSDEENLNEYIISLTSSLLSLLGIDTNDISSREYVLISNIFLNEFKDKKDISLVNLIEFIANPPFQKVGVFGVDTFFPANDRLKLAMKLNSLIASPSFSQWRVGEKLDIKNMFFNKDGKARCNIFSISHLSDSERMFFVTLFLNEMIAWMRTSEGTSSLRAILYMDEIFGFFPPTSNPPSKTPMLTLLKQARAFGLGVVLSTQNPVDLDYKGLSNIGTWFIGRLQTAQDKQKVISGLSGISGSNLDKTELENLLSNLPKRNFLVKNINANGLDVINTRWALSYLKGPLSKEQISNLMQNYKTQINEHKKIDFNSSKPLLSSDITQKYSYGEDLNLEPYLLANAKIRFFDSKKNIDIIKDTQMLLFLDGENSINWDDASQNLQLALQNESKENSKYSSLPSFISSLKNFISQEKDFKEYLYRNIKLYLYSALDMTSIPNESKEEFMIRLQDKCNEILEKTTDEITAKFEKEKNKIEDKLSKAMIKLEKEKNDLKSEGINAVINIGTSILGAIFGGKIASRTNMGKVATGARSAGRVLNQKKDVEYASQSIESINEELSTIVANFENEINELKNRYDIKNIQIQEIALSPKKSDIFDEKITLVWKS
ncbi:MAG: DUF87 domain-containing protein [Campylobacter sputorum]|uniref:ATP-binding protein n=1 Tax=Campylobacter sputorum TaxID=206 RepID=UPI000B76F911|nr:DUF87 domain-containing protein [Campylobacter sputorum]ASM37870.1 AAA domain protein [Campylobacter sputorum bv. paraureolyticus LMG 11764]MDY6121025.1 DUF87 domain-containing protein [Campylobacter sputorum]